MFSCSNWGDGGAVKRRVCVAPAITPLKPQAIAFNGTPSLD